MSVFNFIFPAKKKKKSHIRIKFGEKLARDPVSFCKFGIIIVFSNLYNTKLVNVQTQEKSYSTKV